MALTLRTKMILLVCVIMAAVLGVNAWANVRTFEIQFYEAQQLRAKALAQAIVEDVKRLGSTMTIEDMAGLLGVHCYQLFELNHGDGISHVAVLSRAGRYFAHNDPSLFSKNVNSEPVLVALKTIRIVTVQDGIVLHTLIPLELLARGPDAVIDIGWSRTLLDQAEADILVNSIVLFLLSVMIGSAASLVLLNQVFGQLDSARLAAELAAQAKSNFLATMSHEIRTPVTSVMAVADLMQKTSLTEEQRDYLKILKSATVTLITVLNDILDISKIESGKVVIEAVEFSLHEAVRDVIALGQTSASTKGLYIGLCISKEVPDRVIGDTTRIRQVLFNLMSNAVKFTDQGSISVRVLLRESANPDMVVQFEIEDTGIGIAGEQINQLFTAFSQADSATTRRFGGTGLGLAISKKLVELMGGRIGVESQPGVGSMFWFSLPFKITSQLPAATTTALETMAQPMRSLRILLAEDNRINQMLVRSMLQKYGHNVQIADNGRQALEFLKNEEFDIILMDIQMPEMDGEEATVAIRDLPPPKNAIPILALTADIMPEHRARYLGAGVNDMVAKPIDWEVLSKLINDYV